MSVGVCAVFLATAACDQDSAINNQAEMDANSADSNEMATMNDPSNPYGAVEMQMHDRMMAAKGANVSDTWAAKMIEHHRGAIAMSETLLAEEPDSRFAASARMVIGDQTAEIDKLETMLRPAASATASPPAPAAGGVTSTTPAGSRTGASQTTRAKPATPPPVVDDPHAGMNMSNSADR